MAAQRGDGMNHGINNKNACRPGYTADIVFRYVAEAAATPKGVTAQQARELTGIGPSTMYLILAKLMEQGRLHRMIYGRDVAYFIEPQMAVARRLAVIEEYKQIAKERQRAEYLRTYVPRKPRVPVLEKSPPKPRAVTGPAHLPGPAITTAKTIVTICVTRPWPTRTGTHSVY